MRKAEIVQRIVEVTDQTQVKTEEAVDTILAEIKSALEAGESVILRRFGTFQVRDKSARLGRNPKTGEAAPISARRVVRFKSGNEFKAAVNEVTAEPVLNASEIDEPSRPKRSTQKKRATQKKTATQKKAAQASAKATPKRSRRTTSTSQTR